MLIAALAFGGCHSVETWDNDLYGNFDALWSIIDEHYCFLDDKGVDWDAVGKKYRSEIDPEWGQVELFDHCSRMLAELKDGHTNLISWFDVSYYRNWWSDYPQNFDLRLIEQYYLKFDYRTSGSFMYKLFEDANVGYVRCSSFSVGAGESFLNQMLFTFKDCDGLIIDVRDNGGGDLTNVEDFVRHFINEPITAGYIRHKNGPGHNDFSEPFPISYEPLEKGIVWLKPVVVLTNRSTFSAANNFVSVMKGLKQVQIVGDITGGGCGMPYSSEIPVGWGVRFSAVPIYNADMELTEFGIKPNIRLNMDLELAAEGIDTILEQAITLLQKSDEETSD